MRPSDQPPRVLLIGPVRTDRAASSIGGTTISFGILLDFLQRQEIDHAVINTQKYYGGWRTPLGLAYTLLRTLLLAPRCDLVMANVAQTGTLYAAPLLYLATKVWRRPFVFRMFGGDLIELYERSGKLQRWVLRRTVLRSDLVLLQTKRLVEYFRPMCRRIEWLPTSRQAPQAPPTAREFSRRFVFLSQVKQNKGIDEVLAVRERLDPSYTLDIFGPILEPQYEYLRDCPFYHGMLQPDEVVPTLAKYDVLLLPTFHPGEGYPGIIFEANSVGVPVIATRWLALPEIIDDQQSGVLISPRSTDELLAAMQWFTPANHSTLSRGALAKFAEFESDTVNRRLLTQLLELA